MRSGVSSQEGKFSLGAIEILPGARQALQEAGEPAAAYLYQHQYEAPDEQAEADSVVSVFQLSTGAVLYVITDEARVHTVVMTASDARPTESA
jgi:hypothetical protein